MPNYTNIIFFFLNTLGLGEYSGLRSNLKIFSFEIDNKTLRERERETYTSTYFTHVTMLVYISYTQCP